MPVVKAHRLSLCVPVLALLAACGGSPSTAAAPDFGPLPSPGPSGDLDRAAMAALLLQPQDLPDLPQRREFASAELTRQATPQLALCRPPEPVGPHEVANVLAKSGKLGTVQLFQVVSAFADPTAATAAYQSALDSARACARFTEGTRTFRVQDLTALPARPGAVGFQYRLTTPDVIGGDVRTLARAGRFTVLLTGFGQPPAGTTLLDYQAAALRRALARLPASGTSGP